METFREPRLRRYGRRAATVARAVRAGRVRFKSARPDLPCVDGAALCDLLSEISQRAELVDVTVNRPVWTTTNVRVNARDQVTWLAWGYLYVVKPLGIGVWPRFALGGRIEDGALQQSTRDTFTFTADRSGAVELANLFPAEARQDGSIATDRIPARVLRGRFSAVVVRWSPGTDPRTALESVAARDATGLCAAEAARLADPPMPPVGWEHHPLLRPAESYARSDDGIETHIRDAVGIVRRSVDAPFTPALRLRWSWRLEELPSKLPEDTTLTHDYLSVAVEFDDGHDLTWHWSCALPPGFAYRCPFDHWRRRETHVVVRSGTAELGDWVDEERSVFADHRVAVGGPQPRRVVAVWLISCCFLQGNEGRGTFGRIELIDGDRTIRVL